MTAECTLIGLGHNIISVPTAPVTVHFYFLPYNILQFLFAATAAFALLVKHVLLI